MGDEFEGKKRPEGNTTASDWSIEKDALTPPRKKGMPRISRRQSVGYTHATEVQDPLSHITVFSLSGTEL